MRTLQRFVRKNKNGFLDRAVQRNLWAFLVALGMIFFSGWGGDVFAAHGNARQGKNFADGNYVGKMSSSQFYDNVRKDKLPIPILTYHSIDPDGEGHYTVSPKNFEDQISSLQAAGYHFIDPMELADYLLKNKPLPVKPVMITLDDGYKDNYTYAFPILQKYGVKATIFVIGSYIQQRPEFLTWDEINDMASSGLVFFQNHTWDLHEHENNRDGKDVIAFVYQHEDESNEAYIKRLTEDLKKENHKIMEITGQKVISFAYPGGKSNALTEAALKEAGILLAFDGYNRVCNYRTHFNPYHLKRFNIDPTWSGGKVLKIIENRR